MTPRAPKHSIRALACAQPELQKLLEARGEPTTGTKPLLYQRLRDVMVRERVHMLDEAEAVAEGRAGGQPADDAEEAYVPTDEELALLEERLPSELFSLSIPVVRRPYNPRA